MSNLVGRKYAYFRHKNAHNIKEVQHTSKKKIIFIVLCIQLQHTYIKKLYHSVAHSSLFHLETVNSGKPSFQESDPHESE